MSEYDLTRKVGKSPALGMGYDQTAPSDAECDAIYYARANGIAKGERPGSGDGVARDRDLIRVGYRAGYRAALTAAPRGIPREPTPEMMKAVREEDRDIAADHWRFMWDVAAEAAGLSDDLASGSLSHLRDQVEKYDMSKP
jgi:hypothetical protein